MTVFEHILLGVDGALAAGLNRRWGWPIVALAGLSAAIPDWDGLTILAGSFDTGHRIWGHNLLVAGLVGLAVAVLVRKGDLFPRVQQAFARRSAAFAIGEPAEAGRRAQGSLLLWGVVGVLAAYSHLAADLFFSFGKDLPVWELQLFWPFSDLGFAVPMVRWGDIGATILFTAGMFAMLRWRPRTQAIAVITLAAVAGYVLLRGLVLGYGSPAA